MIKLLQLYALTVPKHIFWKSLKLFQLTVLLALDLPQSYKFKITKQWTEYFNDVH